jgi:hypothetical protein
VVGSRSCQLCQSMSLRVLDLNGAPGVGLTEHLDEWLCGRGCQRTAPNRTCVPGVAQSHQLNIIDDSLDAHTDENFIKADIIT